MTTALSPEQVTQWKEEGYTVVPGMIDVEEAVREMTRLFPQGAAGALRQGFGNIPDAMFPSPSLPFVNKITTDEKLLDAVGQLLGTEDFQCIQSAAWAKYGENLRSSVDRGDKGKLSNQDQRLHMDYGNNMWVHPPQWYEPNAVTIIIYFSDVRETGGGTAVTPRHGKDDPLYQWPYQHMPGIGGLPHANDKKSAEEIVEKHATEETKALRKEGYAREIRTAPTPGSVLFYRHDIWHRGTPVNPGCVRYVMNIAWVKKESLASGMNCWHKGATMPMYHGWLEKFVQSLSGKQLRSIGFPRGNHPMLKDRKMREAINMRYRPVDIVSKL